MARHFRVRVDLPPPSAISTHLRGWKCISESPSGPPRFSCSWCWGAATPRAVRLSPPRATRTRCRRRRRSLNPPPSPAGQCSRSTHLREAPLPQVRPGPRPERSPRWFSDPMAVTGQARESPRSRTLPPDRRSGGGDREDLGHRLAISRRLGLDPAPVQGGSMRRRVDRGSVAGSRPSPRHYEPTPWRRRTSSTRSFPVGYSTASRLAPAWISTSRMAR
jgi:hypothetical protein